MKSAQLCFKAISFEDDGWPKHELGISPWICSGTISWNNAPWSHKSNIMVTYIWLSLATCTTTYCALSSEWVGCCTAWVVCIRAAVKCVHLEEWVSKEMSFNKQSFSSKLCSLVWLCTTSNKRYPTGFLCTLHIYICVYISSLGSVPYCVHLDVESNICGAGMFAVAGRAGGLWLQAPSPQPAAHRTCPYLLCILRENSGVWNYL